MIEDIDKFINTRKQLKISQVALSAGICTQATLSKFEHQQQTPSLEITSALCSRLNLTLDDIFIIENSNKRQEEYLLQQIFRALSSQNDMLFETVVRTCDVRQFSLAGYQLLQLCRYFKVVLVTKNTQQAKKLLKTIVVSKLTTAQCYFFYAITAYYYQLIGRTKEAGQIVSDLLERKDSIMSGEYSIVKIMTIYTIAMSQRDMQHTQASVTTAAKGIALSNQYDQTAFLENFFWLIIDASPTWSSQHFVVTELTKNACCLAKMHGNQWILDKINQQSGRKQ